MRSGDSFHRDPDDPQGGPGSSREHNSFFSKAYENFVPEIVRKTVLLGLGGVAMTEDGVRRALTELRLPREEARRVFDYLVEQSQRSKVEILGLVSSEVKSFLRSLSLEEELRRALAGMRIKIQAEISFEQIDGAATEQKLKLRTTFEPDEPDTPDTPDTPPHVP